MNKRLARFLTSLVGDPERLDAFNDPDRRASVLETADLSQDDKDALLTGESGAVLRQLAVKPGDVEWVVAPGVKKATIAFGIKAFKTIFGIKGGPPAPSRRPAGRSASKGKARRSAKKSKSGKKSKG
jgi:hypothetical protein